MHSIIFNNLPRTVLHLLAVGVGQRCVDDAGRDGAAGVRRGLRRVPLPVHLRVCGPALGGT